jgi:ABC-type glutathione transport system ATPase component
MDARGATEAVLSPAAMPILAARKVTKVFRSAGFGRRSETRALDNVSLAVMPGETAALVGESGSGKSTLGRVLAGLVPIDGGAVTLEGQDLAALTARDLRRRRRAVQVIFQDPYASLDPRFTAGRTIAEPMIIHGLATRREAAERAGEFLRLVGLGPDAASRYPHQFSGGQRQRIAIARALAAEPRVLIADEPTSALDVSVQAQVLDLLRRLRAERGIAMVFISHDLAVVRQIADRVAVMRAGRILELGPTEAIFTASAHAYTRALLSAVPMADPGARNRPRIVQPPDSYPAGPLRQVAAEHWVAM